ncbi:hypothetical protein ELI49_17230 [Rhizobium ruizarguesonis]|jgi:hypothetical protein|uniref:Uncharacterized protein n=1 Tax=Rhizobium ruizarguesonis TaxID=2081791 RepID=A0AB38I9E7_9HYPH|nr:hypothetical protein [Rhizobium ruizarguesonis]QIJ41862.1 hypothetical protein G7039_17680 [Rhizobium leguminosarum]TCA29362.1 hypothetical protein E0H70_17875 [Rhizobium leguminosarum bv. viciae]NEH31306.1 hypothetical protein [Rhizobium ruizarguesonis]NEI08393.1 hypothetical protein [Rhizobium ruizarguesonis]NEI30367.1 hypothetical protein [Rhizobium ruizarguesonis]
MGLDDAYNHFSMQCRNLRFRITMKQCRCKLKKITYAPIIFLPTRIKRRAEKISPARFERRGKHFGRKHLRDPARTLLKPGATTATR